MSGHNTRMDRETRIKKLKYQSWYRGNRETDKIIGHFARIHLDTMTEEELNRFEAILNEDDVDLFHWFTRQSPLPEKYTNCPVMAKLYAFEVSSYL